MEMTVVALMMLALVVVVGVSVKLYDLKRKREEEAVAAQARIADALLMDSTLAALPLTPTAHLPLWKGSPLILEIKGAVPSPELRGGRSGGGDAGDRPQPARLPHRGPDLGGSARPQPRGHKPAFASAPLRAHPQRADHISRPYRQPPDAVVRSPSAYRRAGRGREGSSASAIHALQEFACGEDGDPSERAQFSEIPVARHDIPGTAGHRALEKLVIVGISPHYRQTPPDTDGLHEGEQLVLDQ